MDPLAYEEPEIATQAVEEPPPKKKRGRKKKEVAPKEAVPDTTMEEPPVEQAKEPEPEPEPAMETPNVVETQGDDAPKRRRGRPRKSAVAAQPIVIDLDSEPDVPVDPVPPKEEEEPAKEPAPKLAAAPKAKAKAPAKRGRKKKPPAAAAAKSTEFVPEEKKEEETTPLSEISENMPSKPLSSGAKEIPASDDEDEGGDDHDAKLVAEEETPGKVALVKDATPVKKEVAKPKLANPASSSSKGKVPLRVGLSRRSRIAPLLKSLRK